jgi:hypothetical protein
MSFRYHADHAGRDQRSTIQFRQKWFKRGILRVSVEDVRDRSWETIARAAPMD